MVIEFSALGAATVIRPFALFMIVYAVLVAVEPEGSNGTDTRYFSLAVKTERSISDVQEAAPVLQTAVAVVVIDAGSVPLLSIAY